MTASTTTQTTSTRAQPRLARRGLVVAGAVAAAVLVWLIAVPVFGISVTVPEGPGSTDRVKLAFGAVVGTAAVAALAGWALLAVLERITDKARAIWTVVAVVALVLTLPYLPGFTGSERLVLGSMHLAVAGVLIPGLRQLPGRSHMVHRSTAR